jgi:hypothetical protein
LFCISGDEQRSACRGNLDTQRFLDTAQVFVLVTKKIMKETVILKL